jgi:CRISPR/Cas system type I-B associated protein Csh2 (Cas7 group RAMP superfamily)
MDNMLEKRNEQKIILLMEEKNKNGDVLNSNLERIDTLLGTSKVSTRAIKKMSELKSLLSKVDYFTYVKYATITHEIKLRKVITKYLTDTVDVEDINTVLKYKNDNILTNFSEDEIKILNEISKMKIEKKGTKHLS